MAVLPLVKLPSDEEFKTARGETWNSTNKNNSSSIFDTPSPNRSIAPPVNPNSNPAMVSPNRSVAPSTNSGTPASKPATTPVASQPTITSPTSINNDAIAAQLEAIKQKALEVQSKVQKLAEIEKSNASSIVGSSDSVVQDEKQTTADINNITANNASESSAKQASDAYLKLLDDQMTDLEKRRKDEVDAIERQFAEAKSKTESAQKSEVGTTSVGIARMGGYLGGSGSGTGVMLNLAQTHRNEITALEAKKAAAINEANMAITDKQFNLAKLKANEIKDIEKEINVRRNTFFDQSLKLTQEQRQQDEEKRLKDKAEFDRSLSLSERVAPTMVAALESFDNEADAAAFIAAAAKDYGVDPDLLLGEVNSIMATKRDAETKAVQSLAQKFIDADIDPNSDTMTEAMQKIRQNSKTYKLDIMKSEVDIANTQSLATTRQQNASVDFNDPILSLYTKATGKIVGSPGTARGIIGYAENILGDKEIVSDDFDGQLLDNQIKASEAEKLVSDSFRQLKGAEDTELDDSSVWQWLATDEAVAMNDEEKKLFIMQAGKDPETFGYY